MSNQASDPLSEIDALVQSYLDKQAQQVDAEAGLTRIQAAMRPARQALASRWRRGLRFAFAAGVASVVALAFFGGWYLSPVEADAKELVSEVKRVHNQPLARCYLVEIQHIVADDEERAALVRTARHVRVWTRGDRFWVEMQHRELAAPFVWGRGENGTLWAVLDSHRGVRVPLEQAPRPLQRIAELYTLNVDNLLGEVLQDCTLTEHSHPASKLTRTVLAEPRSDRTRRWLGRATLEIDTEAKVLRRMAIVRNLLGKPLANVTFTLLETRPDDAAKYQLEGHLEEPFHVFERDIEPRVKLELVGRWLGVRKEGRGAKSDGKEKNPAANGVLQFKDTDGRSQNPLAQPEKKATVLFFLLPDCPISNSYAPEIQRIVTDYESKKVAGFVVHADPDVTVDQAKKHAHEFGISCPVLLDPAHKLVKSAGVTMAPEVAVIAPDGKVLYRGRIDDWYVEYGKRRAMPTQRYLRDALDAILQDKAVPTPTTQAIGCYLPEPKP